ncbi:MAG: squalene/phytoene synthase family protein [Rhodospirillales bacterium]|nr:squalene/phytoene synthase family protein [Rhodospirillales bacterium]
MNNDDWQSICAETVHRLDRDRLMCTTLAPVEKQAPLLALLAFNMEIATIPELVSETIVGEMRLQWWRDTIEQLYSGKRLDHPVALGLAEAIRDFDLTKSLFDDYMDGRSFDLYGQAPASLEELESYGGKTAGSLNELMGEVLLADLTKEHRATVRHAGIAWALSGLLVAAAFHSRLGRSYLPADVEKGEQVAYVAQCAQAHIDKARKADQVIPNALLPVMLPVTLAAHRLGRLARCHQNVGDPRLQRPALSRLFGFYWNVLRKRY